MGMGEKQAGHLSVMISMGLHAMAILGQVVPVGSCDINAKSPYMRLGYNGSMAAGSSIGIGATRCCAGGA